MAYHRSPNDPAVGFVVLALLKPEFEQWLREQPEPDIIPKLISRPSVLCDDLELGHINASGILTGSVIGFGIVKDCPEGTYGEIDMALMEHSINYFREFKLFEMMIEAHSAKIIKELVRVGFVVVNDYKEWWNENDGKREVCPLLMTINRQQAEETKDYNTMRMFYSGEPKFGFKVLEREVIEAALQGKTDADIAAILSIGQSTLKKRWGSIYDKALEIFDEDMDPEHKMKGLGSSAKERAKEKRRTLVEYVRAHREELRPFGIDPRRKNSD